MMAASDLADAGAGEIAYSSLIGVLTAMAMLVAFVAIVIAIAIALKNHSAEILLTNFRHYAADN